MEKLNATSIFSGLLRLEYKSAVGRHVDKYYCDRFSMWRDVFPEGMRDQLLGKTSGSTVRVELSKSDSPIQYNPRLIKKVRPTQLTIPSVEGETARLQPGRFYPQSILSGITDTFSVSVLPCRYLGPEGDFLAFDLNHPLAGRDLKLSLSVQAINQKTKERGGRCEDWLETIALNGPGMQGGRERISVDFTKLNWNQRKDEEEDSRFYSNARMVHHLDSKARDIIGSAYSQAISRGGKVLDLMASWDSHLPSREDISLHLLGLNREELSSNPTATSYIVQDLNKTTSLPYESESFDTVICTASIEYLVEPQKVIKETARILRSGGRSLIAFSNRYFPTKAIKLWTELHDYEKIGFVSDLLLNTGEFVDISTVTVRGYPRPEDDPHQEISLSDPVYLVSALRK